MRFVRVLVVVTQAWLHRADALLHNQLDLITLYMNLFMIKTQFYFIIFNSILLYSFTISYPNYCCNGVETYL